MKANIPALILKEWQMKKSFLTICTLIFAQLAGCGKSQHADSDVDYRFLHSPFPEAPEYVSPEHWTRNSLITKTLRPIQIGVQGRANTISNNDIKTMVLTWLAPLRQKSTQVTQSVNVSSNTGGVDLIVNFTSNAGKTCGQTRTNLVPFIIDLYPNDSYEGLFHEFGHGFGLGDTYNPRVGSGCVSGQPDSVMCSARSRTLMQDDIAGITALFCQYNNCNGGGGPIDPVDPGIDPIIPGGGDDQWLKFAEQYKFFGVEKLKCGELYITNLSGDKSVNIRSAPSKKAPVVTSLQDGAVIRISGAIAGDDQTRVSDPDLARSGKMGSKGEAGVEYIWLKIISPAQGWVSKLYAECR